jgi:hypothetical protein
VTCVSVCSEFIGRYIFMSKHMIYEREMRQQGGRFKIEHKCSIGFWDIRWGWRYGGWGILCGQQIQNRGHSHSPYNSRQENPTKLSQQTTKSDHVMENKYSNNMYCFYPNPNLIPFYSLFLLKSLRPISSPIHTMSQNQGSIYLLIWDFLLSQPNIWTTTAWSNVWVGHLF